MIKEFDRIILTEDLPNTLFVKGDVGTVIMVHERGKRYEIEFFAADGSTLGVETVRADQIISSDGVKKVLHVNDIAA